MQVFLAPSMIDVVHYTLIDSPTHQWPRHGVNGLGRLNVAPHQPTLQLLLLETLKNEFR